MARQRDIVRMKVEDGSYLVDDAVERLECRR